MGSLQQKTHLIKFYHVIHLFSSLIILIDFLFFYVINTNFDVFSNFCCIHTLLTLVYFILCLLCVMKILLLALFYVRKLYDVISNFNIFCYVEKLANKKIFS